MSKMPLFAQALLPLALIIFFLSGLLILRNGAQVEAQGQCTALNTSPHGAWPQGTTTTPTVVTVWLDNSLSGWLDSNEVNALKQAFTNWSTQSTQSATGCNCNVTFQYSNTVNSGTYRLTVRRELPENLSDRGDFRATGSDGNGRLTSATIRIHPNTYASGALTRVMAHETGHTFGLEHCTSGCKCIHSDGAL